MAKLSVFIANMRKTPIGVFSKVVKKSRRNDLAAL
jgi:hypothetical protein